MGLLVTVVLLAVAAAGAAYALKLYWDLDAMEHVPAEVISRVFALPGSGSSRLRRRFVRSLTGERIVMPSGTVHAARLIAVVVAEPDLGVLCPTGEVDELAADAAKLYVAYARRRGWELDPARTTRVFIESDPGRHSGWTPRARVLSAPLLVAAGDSSRTPVEKAQPQPGQDRDAPFVQRVQSGADDETTEPTRGDDGSDTTVYVPEGGPLELREVNGTQRFPLDRTRLTIGRSDERDIVVDLSGVSRDHAVLELGPDGWRVSDVGSANGTWLDGQRMAATEKFPVRPGALLQFGPKGPVFRLESAQDST